MICSSLVPVPRPRWTGNGSMHAFVIITNNTCTLCCEACYTIPVPETTTIVLWIIDFFRTGSQRDPILSILSHINVCQIQYQHTLQRVVCWFLVTHFRAEGCTAQHRCPDGRPRQIDLGIRWPVVLKVAWDPQHSECLQVGSTKSWGRTMQATLLQDEMTTCDTQTQRTNIKCDVYLTNLLDPPCLELAEDCGCSVGLGDASTGKFADMLFTESTRLSRCFVSDSVCGVATVGLPFPNRLAWRSLRAWSRRLSWRSTWSRAQ